MRGPYKHRNPGPPRSGAPGFELVSNTAWPCTTYESYSQSPSPNRNVIYHINERTEIKKFEKCPAGTNGLILCPFCPLFKAGHFRKSLYSRQIQNVLFDVRTWPKTSMSYRDIGLPFTPDRLKKAVQTSCFPIGGGTSIPVNTSRFANKSRCNYHNIEFTLNVGPSSSSSSSGPPFKSPKMTLVESPLAPATAISKASGPSSFFQFG